MQRYPMLVGPDAACNRKLRELWKATLEVRTPRPVPYRREVLSGAPQELIGDRERRAIVDTCARLGLDEAEATHKILNWGWKIALAPRTAQRILSLGCGGGHELVLLRALFPDAELHGVDFKHSVPAEWERDLNVSEIHSQPFDDFLQAHPAHFDLVFSNHTLEHLASPDRTLGLIRKALRPGGHCVSALPLEGDLSNPFYGDLADIADGRGTLDAELDIEFINPGHFWKTNHADIASTLDDAGFTDVRMFTREGYPGYVMDSQGPVHVTRLLQKQIFGQALERTTLRTVRKVLRQVYRQDMPDLAAKLYFSLAGRCWFGRHRMLHQLIHEVVFVAGAA